MHFILVVLLAITLVMLVVTLTSPGKLSSKKQNWKWLAGLLVGILLILVATGRLHWIGAVIAAAIPLIRRGAPLLLRYLPQLQQLYQRHKQTQQASSSAGNNNNNQTSTVTTDWLEMSLNHANREMEGVVLAGAMKGKRLSTLTLVELNDLLYECRDDSDSTQLLEAYLDARFGHDWRQQQDQSTGEYGDDGGSMTRQQALKILGLNEGASREEILAAHKRLMQKLHPDRGGNDYLAAQINQAKSVLLKD